MGELFSALLNLGASIVNRLVPKNHRLILFYSIPDYSDNSRAFYEYLVESQQKDLILVWLVDDESILAMLGKKGIRAVRRRSLTGLILLFRAKYIFTTHLLGMWKSKNQILVQLWHGMPLKCMGFLEPRTLAQRHTLDRLRRISNKIDIMISSSAVSRLALATCFGMDPAKIKVTGQPRNDRLLKPVEDISNLEAALNTKISDKKLILYAPTFRRGFGRTDSISWSESPVNPTTLREISLFLSKKNCLLLIKLHPAEERHSLGQLPDNIIVISSKQMQSYSLDVQDVLKVTDVLITDYSSIYFDFLLLDRPIIFFPWDIEEYKKNRGFILEPYSFWAPGPQVRDCQHLISELEKCLKDPSYYRNERRLVNDLINTYRDDKASERVFNLVFRGE